jgi:Protein of unknown function (DUF1499)
MSAIKLGFLILAAVIAIAAVFAVAFVFLPGHQQRLEQALPPPPAVQIDFKTLRKTNKPNQWLVCPANGCSEKPDQIAPVIQTPIDDVAKAWRDFVAQQPDTVERTWDAANYSGNYVQRTARMRYPDVISVQFFPVADGGTTLAIYSRSTYGYSDRGVNKARVQAWLKAITQQIPHAP